MMPAERTPGMCWLGNRVIPRSSPRHGSKENCVHRLELKYVVIHK